MAHGADGVDLAVNHGGRGPGPAVAIDALIARRVGVRPDRLARAFVQAEDALGLGALGPIRHVDAAVRDRRPGVAGSERLSPANLEPVGGKRIEDSGLPPDPVTLRTAPLRPVVAADR